MAFDFTDRKTLAEALITGLTGSETDKQLAYIARISQGVNASNAGVLEAAIQTFADGQTSSDPLSELAVVSAMMGATEARTITYTSTEYATGSNANYPVPAGATKCFVSCNAGGFNSSNVGAHVVDFEIGVAGGETINVVVGNTHVVGGLSVNFHGNSSAYPHGLVVLNGVTHPINGTTVINSGNLIASTAIALKFEITEVV